MKPRIAITLELSVKEGKRTNFLDLAYVECVERAGGLPFYFPPLPNSSFMEAALAMFEGLVLTGGADIHPSFFGEEITAPITLSPDQRTEFDLALFRKARKAGKPILAICHGMQIMNVALGGTLIQDLGTQAPGSLPHRGEKDSPPARHAVRLEPGSTIDGVMQGLGEFEVTSSHHQSVKVPGTGLKVTARAPDGIIEGIELPGSPNVIGIQWHPEKDPESEPTRRIFQWLIDQAK